MDFLRLRLLQAIVPLVTVAVTVPLLLAGVGVWALVIGPFCGNVAAVDRGGRGLAVPAAPALRARGGAPLPALLVAGLRHRRWRRCAVAQGQVAVFGLSDDGLAAAGWITLAATLTRYADRADQIVATTIYPAIVRVRDRIDVLEELFAKSNRLTLMWAFPFGAGLVLFGADLVRFVLGDEWEPAIVLLGGLAAATALQQLGYNWFAFFRARGESRPQAVESAAFAGSFAAFAVPGALAVGELGLRGRPARLHGLRAGRAAGYVRRLLPGVRLCAIAWRAALPVAGGHARRCGAAAGAVGRRAAARAGGGGAGAVAGRRWRWPRAGSSRACSASCGATCARRRPGWSDALVRRAPRTGALLWFAAALISGFTMRRYLEPFDEGLLLQAATRMADGQWPYRDFGWAYGPGQPTLVAAAFKAFGPSVIWWRLLRVAADATVALLVWALARREAGDALGAGRLGSPPRSRSPSRPARTRSRSALAFALGAVLAAARRPSRWPPACSPRWPRAGGRTSGRWRCSPRWWRRARAAAVGVGRGREDASARRRRARGRGRRSAAAPIRSRWSTGRPRSRATARRWPSRSPRAWRARALPAVRCSRRAPRLWDQLVATAVGDGGWWRLPFPRARRRPARRGGRSRTRSATTCR